MAVTILIPTALRAFTDRKSEVEAEGATVGEVIRAFAEAYPDIKQHLYQDGAGEAGESRSGELRSFINVFVGETNIKNLGGLAAGVKPGDTIMLVPAIAGGGAGE
ncbi:MAG: MoaD/ThiS family protein [Spirochaetaceae bacterium]|jgi:adenylyltransferase/sulfurtransferase|nr:MoaD/ThiS family protein [Spirochaetaceae bacterium]